MSHTSPGAADVFEECRICRDGASAGVLSSACRCATLVHSACLRRWVSHRADALFPLLLAGGRDVCEVCRGPFRRDLLHGSVSLGRSSLVEEGVVADKGDASWWGGSSVVRRIAEGAGPICEWVMSVEGCLLIFLFVLAVMGHVLFLVGMYQGASKDQYSIERVALGVANAVLTISLLVLVQKIVSRWLRESDFFAAVASAYCVNDVEAAQMLQSQGEGRRGCGFVSQVLLGGVLSVLAAAEIFFLLRQLPLGTLA